MHLPLICLALFTLADDPVVDDSRPLFDRGDELGFDVPLDEELDFVVLLDMAVVGETSVGSFRLSAGVEEHRAGLAASEPGKSSGKRIGWIRGQAGGTALNYTLDHTIEARIMPQSWPHVIYRDTQRGSENRRREIMYGERGGKPTSWYRADTHCKACERPEHQLEGTWPFSADHHCKKCKRGEHRLWRRPTTQEVPAGAVDMLSAIHLARAMVKEGRKRVEFPLLAKDSYWDVTMTMARSADIKTPAGTFHCVEVKLDPQLPKHKKEGRFKGLFGIHGTLSFWLEKDTGVPIEISGEIPAGPFTVDIALRLEHFRGTPESFAPIKE